MSEGLAARIARAFIDNPVTPILTILAILLGSFALSVVAREEEPQIDVPLVDVIVGAPGLDARDGLEVVTKPLEDIVAGVDGVDHVYSRTREGQIVVSARFHVGTNADQAVLRVIERVGANGERAPPGVSEPLIVGRGIEDVAVVVLTLTPGKQAAERYDHGDIFDLAQQLRWRMSRIDEVGITYVVGSGPSEIRVEPDLDALARWALTPQDLTRRIEAANAVLELDSLQSPGERKPGLAGRTLASPAEIGNLLVASRDGRPVYVRDVAEVILAAPQPGALAWHKAAGEGEARRPAASLAIAKQPGANGVEIAEAALDILKRAETDLLPSDVEVHVTRNYGETAAAKARTLFLQLLSATAVIVLLIAAFVGLREALVVGIVIPTTILLTFFMLWVMGYTINRVSLFALIFSIGILVDDAIVVVENITRWWSRGDGERLGFGEAAVKAVDEVGNPTIISTLTIIAALLPMLAVSGLMGPYMAPIPANASAAVTISTLLALTATPWMMLHLRGLRLSFGLFTTQQEGQGRLGRGYRRIGGWLLSTPRRALLFLSAVLLATLASFSLFVFTIVPVKLLPFDDKEEIQIVLDLPETASVEETDRALNDLSDALADLPELESVQMYAGTSAPFNFNGLVRQYYLRESPELGDIAVNLKGPQARDRQSHAVALDIRERLQAVSLPEGTALRVAETPPGPPVFATLLAEVYGPDAQSRRAAARELREAYEAVPFIVDVDDTIGAVQSRVRFEIDRSALDLFGVREADVLEAIDTLIGRQRVGQTYERFADGGNDIVVELNKADRIPEERLLSVAVPAQSGDGMVELGQVARMVEEEASLPIFRRNGQSLIMVQGNLAGAREAPIYGMLAVQDYLAEAGSNLDFRLVGQPPDPAKPVALWEGEWEITYVTFRDMGAAFSIAFLVIYAIVVWRFQRLKLPLLIMVPVPLTLLGVILGHWAVGAKFTATSMIGFIALAGIVVRNSILLIEFIEARRAEGMAVYEAVLEAGAVRFRPIFLTAVTAMVGALFIMADPIFRGLAVSLFFGLFSATMLTTLVIPAVYMWRRGGANRNVTATEQSARNETQDV